MKNKNIIYLLIFAFMIIIAISLISGCKMNTSSLGGWNHVETVRVYGKNNRLSTEDYMTYQNSQYVESIDFLRYNYCTTEGEVSHFDESEIQLHTSDGVKTLNYHTGRPVFVLGYNLSLSNSLDMEFEVIEGRMFEKNDECIIMHNSERTDESWNSLQIGDKIIFENAENNIYKKFTVVGILQENINNDKNSNTRLIHTTLESAKYFDVLNQERLNMTHRFPEYPKKDFLMGYEAVIHLTYNSYDRFYRYVYDISDDTQSIEPIDPVMFEPLY